MANIQIVSSGDYLRIFYQSIAPILPPDIGRAVAFACEVTASPWGSGVAQAVGLVKVLGDGMAPGSLQKQNTRNTLTFDGVDGLGRFSGVKN